MNDDVKNAAENIIADAIDAAFHLCGRSVKNGINCILDRQPEIVVAMHRPGDVAIGIFARNDVGMTLHVAYEVPVALQLARAADSIGTVDYGSSCINRGTNQLGSEIEILSDARITFRTELNFASCLHGHANEFVGIANDLLFILRAVTQRSNHQLGIDWNIRMQPCFPKWNGGRQRFNCFLNLIDAQLAQPGDDW